MTPKSRNSEDRTRRPLVDNDSVIMFPQQWIRLKKQCIDIQSYRVLGNAYRNVSVHTATNLQRRVTAKSAITLLLKEVISIQFDQNLPQGENWATEDIIKQNAKYDRPQKRTEHIRRSGKSEVKPLVYEVFPLFVFPKCYIYSKIVLKLIADPPGEYPIYRFIYSGTHKLLVALPGYVTTGVRNGGIGLTDRLD
jgi:hypothetical protein